MNDHTVHPDDAQALKACCAAAYESEWARLLLGESFHPGGVTLTRRLGELLALLPDDTVLDVACGRGTSAIILAEQFGCRVEGIDLSEANIEAARAAAAAAGVADRTSFRVGDAEALPAADASADALICECAFCTFPDKAAAAREFRRVLRPGGRLGLADFTRRGLPPADLRSLLAWVACIADALPVEEYGRLFSNAGLAMTRVEPQDAALRKLVRDVRLGLLAAEVAAGVRKQPLPRVEIESAKRLLRAAGRAIDEGSIGYAIILGRAGSVPVSP